MTELRRTNLIVQMDRKSIVCKLCVLLEHGTDVLQRLRVFRLLKES